MRKYEQNAHLIQSCQAIEGLHHPLFIVQIESKWIQATLFIRMLNRMALNHFKYCSQFEHLTVQCSFFQSLEASSIIALNHNLTIEQNQKLSITQLFITTLV